jgi:acetyl-CoA C-acetyltransferase
MKREIYLVDAVRTAVGGFCGAFEQTPAVALGSAVIKATLARAGVSPEHVEEVIFGNVLSAGLGQNLARQIAIRAGLSPSTGATTVNKVCGSSLKAVMLGAQAIQCEDADIVVAGGSENMSRAPYLLERARTGYRMGNAELVDSMVRDGLWDVYGGQMMGMYGDRLAAKFGFSRQEQDDFAVASFQRALAASARGIFKEEIVPLEASAGKGTVLVAEDETPKRFNEEKLRHLPPVFDKNGTITAGNASSLNDGAAAVLLVSAEKAADLGLRPQARILGYATYSREPEWFTLAPIGAITRLASQLNLSLEKVDLFEINEAFAVVPMAAMKHLSIPHDKVNVHGGAVALGHPIGASGARTLVTLLNAMKHRGARIGIDSICIGGGEAVAIAVELC